MARRDKPKHGSLNLVHGRYYYKVVLPGTTRRKTYPLMAPGHTTSTRERRLAIMLANDLWEKYAVVPGKNGEVDLPLEMTLKQYTDKYIEMRKPSLAPATVLCYEISIRYALAFFGEDRIIDAITPLSVQEFKLALATGKLKHAVEVKKDLNRVTVNLHMRGMRAVMNFAVKKLNILLKNPFSGSVETVKVSKNWHYVGQAEFLPCLEAATSNYRVMIALCRLAALRRLEAYYLEWDDVNFDKGTLHIVGKDHWQPKDRESRVIPICPELQKILLEEFEQAPDKRSRVCSLEYSGNIGRDIRSTIIRAGLNLWAKPLHTLRKSCITDWAGTYPLHVVKEWAGHADIATTATYYTQVTPDQFEKAATVSFWKKEREGVATTGNS